MKNRPVPDWPGNTFSVSIVLLATLLLVPANACGQRPDPDAPAPVVISTALLKDQANPQRFVGTLQPTRTSTVGSAVEGRIVEMEINQGDLVGRLETELSHSTEKQDEADSSKSAFEQSPLGQVIAKIESDALDIQIAAARLELQARQQALEELKLSLPSDIKLAETIVAQAKAQLDYDRDNYERQKNLLGRGGGLSEREVAEAQTVFQAQQQTHLAAETSLEKLKLTKQIKLDIAETAVLAQDNELKRLAEELDRHTIRAPFEGAVVMKMADIGDWVSRGSPIAQLVQLNPIELSIQVPQKFLPQLQASIDQALESNEEESVGPVAEITIDGFKEPLFGEVVAIVPQADLRTRSFPVLIRLSNLRAKNGYALKPGMLATASLNIGPSRDVVLIKKDALILGNDKTTVIVAATDPEGSSSLIAKPVIVTLGQSFNDSIEILSGISAGDRVVVQGNERVRPGQKLKVLDE